MAWETGEASLDGGGVGGAWPPTQAPQANFLLTSLENVTFICENGRKRAAGRGFLDEMREKSIKTMICAAGEVKFEDLARLRQPSFPGLPGSQFPTIPSLLHG